MDSQITTTLQNASTSSELSAAISNIPREQTYYNEQIRDLILQKKDLIVDSGSASEVSKFLLDFIDVDLPQYQERRMILTTIPVRDLFINTLLPQVPGESIYFAARSICRICVGDEHGASALYSSTESFEVILSCFHRVSTPEGAEMIVSALNNILFLNPSSNKLLNNIPGVDEAFSALLPHATTENTAKWVISALRVALKYNEELRRQLAIEQWIDNINKLEMILSDSGKYTAKKVLDILINPKSGIVPLQKASTSAELIAAVKGEHGGEQTRDLILAKKHLIIDSASADAVAEFFFFFASEESERPLLQSAEIRDLIINTLAPKISAGDSVYHFGVLICNVVQDKASAELYSTTESFKAILSCFHRVTTPEGAQWIAVALHNILVDNPSSNKLLNGIPGVVEAFTALIPHATTEGAAEWVISVLNEFLEDYEPARSSFASDEWLENVRKLGKITTQSTATVKQLTNFLVPGVLAKKRAERLKQVALIHNEVIDHNIFRKMAEGGLSSANLHMIGEATLYQLKFSVEEVLAVLPFIHKLKVNNVRGTMPELRQENQDGLRQQVKHDDDIILRHIGDADVEERSYYQVNYSSGKVQKYEVTPQPSPPPTSFHSSQISSSSFCLVAQQYNCATSSTTTPAWFLFFQQQHRNNNPNLRCHPNYCRWISTNTTSRCPRFYFRLK